MLEFNNVCFSYSDKEILTNVSISISSQKIYLLKGNNGEGKTTTCRILSGLENISGGEIIFKGKKVTTEQGFAEYVTYIKQEPELNFITSTPVEELASWNHLFKKKNLRKSIKLALRKLNKSEFNSDKKKLVWQFSGGQQKILSLLPLEFSKNKFWIIDEPETGLDDNQFQQFLEILKTHKSSGNGAIIVSHKIEKYQNIFDEILELKDKKIILSHKINYLINSKSEVK